MNLVRKILSYNNARLYSDVTSSANCHNCKVLIVGGGTGGCNMAWRMSRKMKKNEIIVLEPSDVHYYQPLFTLIAAGIKKASQSHRPEGAVLPPAVTWMRDHAEDFDPCSNLVYTRCGGKIYYEFLVIAVGLKNDYDKIPGLEQALKDPTSGVTTIYAPHHCLKTWCCIKQFQGGHAIFTFPNKSGKCSGAALKIMFLADDYFRKHKIRGVSNITYNTGNEAIFGVAKYASAVSKLTRDRGIVVNRCTELAAVDNKAAVFLDTCGTYITLPYNFLHVTPPMSPPTCLSKCFELVTDESFLDVDKYTLQHNKYSNVFGIGDCTSTPNSKTAAAIAEQSWVLERNLLSAMLGKQLTAKYNGYGACPMLTSYRKGILAESVYDKKPYETFPFDQSKERRLFYQLKTRCLPRLYWNKLIKGKWDGTAKIRKIINPFGR